MKRWRASALVLAVHVLGCGGHSFHTEMRSLVARGAYAEAVASTRREPELEKALAEVVLEEAARSTDPVVRRRAFGELALVGSRSRAVLERLTQAPAPITRAHAWLALLQLGDASARDELREFVDSPDPELRALGYSGLDPVDDRALLLAALTQPNQARRAAAVRVLARSPKLSQVRAALGAVVRHDPDPNVRAAALASLGHQGPEAAPAIEAALADEAPAVRVAAVHALGVSIRAVCAAGGCESRREFARLDHDLGGAPTPETLAAASVVLRLAPDHEPDRAVSVFTRALTSGDAALRGRAAVLCRSLPEPGCPAAVLRDRVRTETSPEVKLASALALGFDDAVARAALTELAREPSTPTAIEAASELAAGGHSASRATLLRALEHPEVRVRVGALRAVARLAAGGSVGSDAGAALAKRAAEHLADRDGRVRTAAAAAILGAGFAHTVAKAPPLADILRVPADCLTLGRCGHTGSRWLRSLCSRVVATTNAKSA